MNLLTVNFISLLFLVVLVYEFYDCYCFLFTYYPFLGKCIMNTHTFFETNAFLTFRAAKLPISCKPSRHSSNSSGFPSWWGWRRLPWR